MSRGQQPTRTEELGELFVSVTGDETVTERQDAAGAKEPVDETDEFDGIDDGLDDAVGAEFDADVDAT